jgi:hypothetical protein
VSYCCRRDGRDIVLVEEFRRRFKSYHRAEEASPCELCRPKGCPLLEREEHTAWHRIGKMGRKMRTMRLIKED